MMMTSEVFSFGWDKHSYDDTLYNFMEKFKQDPSGVAQDLVDTWPQLAKELAKLTAHFSELPALEKK